MPPNPIMGAVVEIRPSGHGRANTARANTAIVTLTVHPISERRVVTTAPAAAAALHAVRILDPDPVPLTGLGKALAPVEFFWKLPKRNRPRRRFSLHWTILDSAAADQGGFHAAPIYRNHFAWFLCKCRIGGRGRLDGLVVRNQRRRRHRQLDANRFGITLRGVRHLLPEANYLGETADSAVKWVLPSSL
jgi:hypothetical protein